MLPCDGPTVCPPKGVTQTPLEKSLRVAAVGSMLMTAPQVWTVWTAGGTGVSLISWIGYLIAAILWLTYGIKKQDAVICFANGGWVLMDLAIIAGILVKH